MLGDNGLLPNALECGRKGAAGPKPSLLRALAKAISNLYREGFWDLPWKILPWVATAAGHCRTNPPRTSERQRYSLDNNKNLKISLGF